MFFGNDCGVRDREGAAHVDAPLARSESSLAIGGAQPHQRARRKRELPRGMTAAQAEHRFARESPRLVESALRILGAMQWDGDDQHFSRRLISQLGNGHGEHAAEIPRGRMQAVVFERVDGFAHAAFVKPVRNGANKVGRSNPASAAKRGGVYARVEFRSFKRIAAA